MRNMIIAGNWKMNSDLKSAESLAKDITNFYSEITSDQIKVVMCPPFVYLNSLEFINNTKNVFLGAQNCNNHTSGAFTGEVSPPMLKEIGAKYVILGHSERRAFYCESNEFINSKIKLVIKEGLIPIICVGETLEQRQTNQTNEVLLEQLEKCLEGIENSELERIVIAYEPVWAIGTGVSASPEQANETQKYVRHVLYSLFGAFSNVIPVLYGGSMNEKNAEELLSQEFIDGGLIGGASLKSDSFNSIIKIAISIISQKKS